jgi:hypothetical protein
LNVQKIETLQHEILESLKVSVSYSLLLVTYLTLTVGRKLISVNFSNP